MKKLILSCLIFIIPILLCSCGDTSAVNIENIKSDIYTEDDIKSGINLIKTHFQKNFDGCELRRISYVGDERMDEFKEWQSNYKLDEVIIFETDFFVGEDAEECFNPNDDYKNWKFILARNKGENWKYMDSGY